MLPVGFQCARHRAAKPLRISATLDFASRIRRGTSQTPTHTLASAMGSGLNPTLVARSFAQILATAGHRPAACSIQRRLDRGALLLCGGGVLAASCASRRSMNSAKGVSRAASHARSSRISRRRPPRSHRLTCVCSHPSFTASCTCVSPAAVRYSRSSWQRICSSDEWIDLSIGHAWSGPTRCC